MVGICWVGELWWEMVVIYGTSIAYLVFGSPEKDSLLVLKGLVTAARVIFCHLARPLLPHY